jgi:hypothetical protein
MILSIRKFADMSDSGVVSTLAGLLLVCSARLISVAIGLETPCDGNESPATKPHPNGITSAAYKTIKIDIHVIDSRSINLVSFVCLGHVHVGAGSSPIRVPLLLHEDGAHIMKAA